MHDDTAVRAGRALTAGAGLVTTTTSVVVAGASYASGDLPATVLVALVAGAAAGGLAMARANLAIVSAIVLFAASVPLFLTGTGFVFIGLAGLLTLGYALMLPADPQEHGLAMHSINEPRPAARPARSSARSRSGNRAPSHDTTG